jgi:hypothetical protein
MIVEVMVQCSMLLVSFIFTELLFTVGSLWRFVTQACSNMCLQFTQVIKRLSQPPNKAVRFTGRVNHY